MTIALLREKQVWMVVQDLLAKLDQQEQMENVVNLGLRGLMDKRYIIGNKPCITRIAELTLVYMIVSFRDMRDSQGLLGLMGRLEIRYSRKPQNHSEIQSKESFYSRISGKCGPPWTSWR